MRQVVWIAVFVCMGCSNGSESGRPSSSSFLGVLAYRSLGSAQVEACAAGGVAIAQGVDVNANGVLDDAEIQGTFAVCNGEQGVQGPAGAPGAAGLNGSNGINGVNGTNGADGIDCWDLNGNGSCDGNEDTNTDTLCNVLDCRGADGVDGAPGMNGAPGMDGAPGAPGLDGVPGEGLALWLELDEVVPPFLDQGVLANDAEVPGGGVTPGSLGHTGNGVYFSGGVIEVPPTNTIPDSPQILAELWVQPQALGGTQVVLEKAGGYALSAVDSRMEFSVTTAVMSCSVSSAQTLTDGTWHHVVAWYNGRTVTVSVDARPSTEECFGGAVAGTLSSRLVLGGRYDGVSVTDAFVGTIDEVRVRLSAPPSLHPTGDPLPGSLLARDMQVLLNEWIGTPSRAWRRCYAKSADGATSAAFHAACDNRGPSITVAQAMNGRVFGGYHDVSWTGGLTNYRSSNGSFLFSQDARTRYPMGSSSPTATYNHPSYGPTFGNGHDFYINSAMDLQYCNFPYAYSYEGVSQANPSDAACQELAGVDRSTVELLSEVEVWIHADQ